MAGHRNGRPRRDMTRAERMRQRMAAAQTADEQLALTFDWFRMSVARIKDAAERARRMREVSEFLVTRVSEIDRSK
jgi:hypothetical protein